MVVVAIIGILAALAVPRFQKFQAKAKQTEAKNNLSHIYTLEESFFGDQDMYFAGANTAALAPIGFSIAGNMVRYGYVTVLMGTGWVGTATEVMAGTVVSGCATADVWTIDQLKNLAPNMDAVALCP